MIQKIDNSMWQPTAQAATKKHGCHTFCATAVLFTLYSFGGLSPISGLLDDLRYYAGAYCSSAFSDSETQSLFDSDWCN